MKISKKNIKGGTGLYLDANDKDAFFHFLNNSTSTYFGSGSNGVTFKLALKPGIQSKYLSLDASDYSQQVTTLLVKVIFLSPIKQSINLTIPETNAMTVSNSTNDTNSTNSSSTQKNVNTSQKEYFYEEVNIQTDVYLKTMQYLQPLTPAIVYADVFDSDDPALKLLNIPNMSFQDLNGQTIYLDKNNVYRMNFFKNNGIQIGLIAMEIMKNPVPLYLLTSEKKMYDSYFLKACQTLIEFVMKTGYNHGDYHGGNILVNMEVTNYYQNRRGLVQIIDFGYAQKLPQNKYNELKTMYKNKEYVSFLNELCDIKRKDNYNMHNFDNYLYTCLIKDPLTNLSFSALQKSEMNVKLQELFTQRELAIDDLVRSFTPKHLPLGNAEKNKMYSGYIHLKKNIDIKWFQNKRHGDYFIESAKKRLLEIKNSNEIPYIIKALYYSLWMSNNHVYYIQIILRLFNVCVAYTLEGYYKTLYIEDLIHDNSANIKLILDCVVLEDINVDTIANYMSFSMKNIHELIELMTRDPKTFFEEPSKIALRKEKPVKMMDKEINQFQELPFAEDVSGPIAPTVRPIAPALGPIAPALGPIAPALGPIAPALGPIAPALGRRNGGKKKKRTRTKRRSKTRTKRLT